jgi:methylenetetrahydrofolate--tRNA-(uracil-5-)-methyltransferase
MSTASPSAPFGGEIPVIGGGLAGSEAAWQLAERGFRVALHEMRPVRTTPAHKTDRLAELVCSNTFKSTELTTAHGLLKAEMRLLGSLVLWAADEARVPGGSALTVDRALFAERCTGGCTRTRTCGWCAASGSTCRRPASSPPAR